MSSDLVIPGGFGPGSQPSEPDGEVLDYMEMPREMATFDLPIAPEPEDIVGMEAGKARLNDLVAAVTNNSEPDLETGSLVVSCGLSRSRQAVQRVTNQGGRLHSDIQQIRQISTNSTQNRAN